jgi:hypothetical protein
VRQGRPGLAGADDDGVVLGHLGTPWRSNITGACAMPLVDPVAVAVLPASSFARRAVAASSLTGRSCMMGSYAYGDARSRRTRRGKDCTDRRFNRVVHPHMLRHASDTSWRSTAATRACSTTSGTAVAGTIQGLLKGLICGRRVNP